MPCQAAQDQSEHSAGKQKDIEANGGEGEECGNRRNAGNQLCQHPEINAI